MPVAGRRYRHWKGGVYEVLGIGMLEATMDEVVLYRLVGDSLIWVRPTASFIGQKDGKPRFEGLERAKCGTCRCMLWPEQTCACCGNDFDDSEATP